MKKEYIIVEWTEKYGWCLFHLGGYDLQECEKLLQKLQEKHPNKQLKIEETISEENWWNQGGLD